MTIGEKLSALRTLRGLTQKEFCSDFNRRFPDLAIKRQQYSHWEGDSRTMQVRHLKALVIFHRVSADDLLFDDRKPDNLKRTKGAKNLLHNVALRHPVK